MQGWFFFYYFQQCKICSQSLHKYSIMVKSILNFNLKKQKLTITFLNVWNVLESFAVCSIKLDFDGTKFYAALAKISRGQKPFNKLMLHSRGMLWMLGIQRSVWHFLIPKRFRVQSVIQVVRIRYIGSNV